MIFLWVQAGERLEREVGCRVALGLTGGSARYVEFILHFSWLPGQELLAGHPKCMGVSAPHEPDPGIPGFAVSPVARREANDEEWFVA